MMWDFISLLLRSGLILATAELLRRLSTRATAANRHRLVLAGFALLGMWPILAALLPEIVIPLPIAPSATASVTVHQTFFRANSDGPVSSSVPWLLLLWLAGVAAAVAHLLIGYISVWRLRRATQPLQDESWISLLNEECIRLGLRKQPQLLTHTSAIVPCTFGLWNTRILLSAECVAWPLVRKRSVLIHELAHTCRRDLLWQLLANLTCAFWWFQPLCWSSRIAMRKESEEACDAVVLHAGVRPSDYAVELLTLAQQLCMKPSWSPAAIAVARRGELEERLYKILDPQPTAWRRPFALLSMATLTALTLAASAVTVSSKRSDLQGGSPMKRSVLSGLLASAGLSAATIGGSVFDPSGAAIANAQASLYNRDTSAKQELTTNPDGKFAFETLAPGSYALSVEKPGFATLYREFKVQQNSEVLRGLMLNVAQQKQPGAVPATSSAGVPSTSAPLIRTGGEAQQKSLVTKVPPVYPPAAKDARLQGPVQLEAMISKEGVPEDIRVVSSPGEELTQSALDAVRQWRYAPTLLNGEPVAVVTMINVNYTLSK